MRRRSSTVSEERRATTARSRWRIALFAACSFGVGVVLGLLLVANSTARSEDAVVAEAGEGMLIDRADAVQPSARHKKPAKPSLVWRRTSDWVVAEAAALPLDTAALHGTPRFRSCSSGSQRLARWGGLAEKAPGPLVQGTSGG
jgi:hypothetical protein